MRQDKSKAPIVSITFPIHKFQEYASEALNSILSQTYKKLEIMFLDNSLNGLTGNFDLSDKRVKYFRLPTNFGLAETLNFAIDHANGKYLARMDYDDIALPSRITEQVNFMESNPGIAISGTNIIAIGSAIDNNINPGQVVKRKLTHEDITKNLLSNNAFFHPTVIFRLEEIKKHNLRYRANYDSAEDLDLWSRASRVVHLANLDEALLSYRLHPGQFSRIDAANSNYVVNKVRISHAFWLIRTNQLKPILGTKILLKLFYNSFSLLLKKRKNKFKKFTI